jgi:protein-S-isoprenylcysteine O-methyltransferase Ste14
MDKKLKGCTQSIKLRENLSNIALAVFFAFFVYRFATHYIETHRLSSLLYVVVETMLFVIAFTRRKPSQISTSFVVWLISFGGAFLPLLALPTDTKDIWEAQVLQIVSILLQGYAILCLNKSFGIVAANRGIITHGFYKLVRHPLYFSYFIGIAGFLLNHLNSYNVFLFSVMAMLQLQRIKYEEDLLSQDSAYQAYMKTTRWRLLPYVY